MKKAFGSISSLTNLTELFTQGLPTILRVAPMNIVRVLLKGTRKNTASKCWSGINNFRQLLKPLLMKRSSRNGSDLGKLILSKSSIQNGKIYTQLLINKKESSFRKNRFFRGQGRGKCDFMRNPILFFKEMKQNRIPHKFSFALLAQSEEKILRNDGSWSLLNA